MDDCFKQLYTPDDGPVRLETCRNCVLKLYRNSNEVGAFVVRITVIES